jgi:hypothetical protein
MKDESTFHIFLQCPHARNLWLAMREVWELPPDELLIDTGKEWLLHLLRRLSEVQRAMTLLTLWRIWHTHNEITHDKSCPSVEGSRRFLVSYLDSLLMIRQFLEKDVEKGKMVIAKDKGFKLKDTKCARMQTRSQVWVKREQGTAKLNVDGSYDATTGAGAGIILRDWDG